MSNITNLNRDYLIKINVKEATIDVPKMTFWNTDKKTSNMFVQLVINMSTNELISQYVTVQNATDYKITLNVIKPKTKQYKTIEATLLNEEKALFEIDLPDEFTDQVGDYSFEFEVSSKVDSNDESITTSNGTYKVNGSILTNLNEETSSSPDLPILKQLIEQVKSLQGGDLTGYQKKNDAAQKTIVEDGKLYLTKLDGTKLDDGTTLPTGSGTSIDDTNTTTDKTWSSSKIDSQFKDIVNKIDSGTINTDTTDDILPRVYLVGDEFSNMTRDKNEVKMQLAYRHRNNNFNANIKIKFQGSSSLAYPKKNFTIKMYTDGTYMTKLKKQFKNWGISTNKYVLKANYIDRTHARNIISARIWGDIVKTRKSIPTFMQSCPNSGAIDGFPVKLFVNGEYQGMYTFNLAKDSYLFNFTDDTNAFICCGESNSGMFYNTTGWTVEYPDVAPTSWTTLITNFVNFINNSTDEEFKTNFNQYADLASFLDYYIFAYSNCGLDSLGKNMIVTSDTGDKLYASMYDLDSTWGLWWNGGKIVDYNYPCPDLYQENNSALWKRFEPIFKDEIYARYIELTTFGMPLNPVDLIERFEEFDEIITEDLIKQDKEIFTALPTVGSYKQIRTFINQRKIYVDDCMLKIKNGTMHETKQIESISINESITQLAQGNTAQLTVSVTPTDITDYTVIWSSNKEDIASVSTSGLVTALKIGDVTITAKIGEIMDTITLSVIENKGALTVKLNANTGYLLGSDSEIAVGNVTTALPINTLGLGYALSNAGNDYSSIVKCGNRKYVKGSVVKTTDEECIGAGWNLLWIRILNETLNGESVKDWVIKNNFEFTYDLSSVNMKWEDYTLPTNRTWGVENLDESYYKCYTKYYTTDITPPDYQFNFPSVWYNNNISHSQKDYYGNNTMGLYTQSWSGNTYLVLTIKKTDLASNTSDAVNKYLTNNPIILKYPVSI